MLSSETRSCSFIRNKQHLPPQTFPRSPPSPLSLSLPSRTLYIYISDTQEKGGRSMSTQGDPISSFDKGDVSFIIIAGAMVFFMIPGLAFLYSGLARRKSALSLIWAVSASNAVVIFQFYLWGYSLAFSSTATNGYIGNLAHVGLRNVLADPSPGSPLIPALLYAFYQMEFACVTVGILVGGIAERGRVLPAMIFSFVWMTLVYCPIACWVWGQNGWAFKWGVYDYAGGGPVEISSGVGGLAYAWVLGRRKEKELINFRPHNVSMVAMGTFMLWFGWIGFNGGSAFGANLRAIMAVWNSMIAAAFGGITWCLLDYRIERRYSMVGFCSGTIAGLVAATPSSGFIHPWSSLIMGIVTGAVCNYATKLKFLFQIDDALDLFAEHAMGGIIGLLFNALFSSSSIIALDGITTAPGGWLDHHWKQLYIQFAYVCAVVAYTFVVTALIALAIDRVPGLRLRTTERGEELGLDDVEIGEWATDYIEVRRDFQDWTPVGNFNGNDNGYDTSDGTQSNTTNVGGIGGAGNEKYGATVTTESGATSAHGSSGTGNGYGIAGDRHARPERSVGASAGAHGGGVSDLSVIQEKHEEGL